MHPNYIKAMLATLKVSLVLWAVLIVGYFIYKGLF
jgi:hypothetical protein